MLFAALLVFAGLFMLVLVWCWMRIDQTFWRDVDDSFDINPVVLPRQHR
jgi:hypothetical protein